MYVPTRLGSIRQTRATRAANQQTREAQRVSEGMYLKLPNIARIAWVRPAVVCHRACSLDPDARVKVKHGFTPQQAWPREDGREVNARELNDVRRQLQSKDMAGARLQETVTSLEALQQAKETLLYPQ